MGRKRHNQSPHSVLILIGSMLLCVLGLLCDIFLFEYTDVLGNFFLPALLLLLGIPITILAYILRRREMVRLRAEMGDAWFYQQFPKERKRAERRLGHPIVFEPQTTKPLAERQAELLAKQVQYHEEKQNRKH